MLYPKNSSSTNLEHTAQSCLLSVIIPSWGDCDATLELLHQLHDTAQVEWIVSAVEPSEKLTHALQSMGVRCVLCPKPSRGEQMNLGAEQACGKWLLFQHADSWLTADHLLSLFSITDKSRIVGGAFYRKFDQRHPYLRFLEPWERLRNRFIGALYGDQSLFVRAETFRQMGGFAPYPLLEDVDFSRRLRRKGPLKLLDPPMRSSPRKHLEKGPWRTTCKNIIILTLYHLGVSTQTLHDWYYGKKSLKNSFPLNRRKCTV
jgi:rSAM/selenodomain-associated transferase 2